MRSTILAYVIAAVGLLMVVSGAWGLFVLNSAEIDIALGDVGIVFASPAPAARHFEKYQPSFDGSLKRGGKEEV